MTLKALPGAVIGSNFGKTSIGSYKGFTNEKKIKNFFDLTQNFFSFCVVLGLRGIIVAPPIMVQSKKFTPKSYYLCITNNEIGQNSKSKPKKFSFLGTFKK